MLPASSLSLSPPRGPRRTRRVCPTRRFRLKSSRVHRSIDRSHLLQRVYRDSRVTYISSDVVAAATRRTSTWPASDRLTPRFDPPAGNKRERESAFSLFTLLFSLPDFIPRQIIILRRTSKLGIFPWNKMHRTHPARSPDESRPLSSVCPLVCVYARTA